MKILKTEIEIAAAPQTVWSILDDLDRYGEWNALVPRIAGRTTVGRILDAAIAYTGQSAIDFRPKILRIVGARELRWVSEIPGDPPSRAEHYFILTPTAEGGTGFENTEIFERAPVLAKLRSEVEKVIKSPEVVSRLHELGSEPGTASESEVRAFLDAETKKWAEVIRVSGAKAD